jgi:hypothetical protein
MKVTENRFKHAICNVEFHVTTAHNLVKVVKTFILHVNFATI